MIILTAFATFVGYFIWKSIQEDRKKERERMTKMWKRFAFDIEHEHFFCPLTPESRNWVLSHRFDFRHLEKQMPDDVKSQFALHCLEVGDKLLLRYPKGLQSVYFP